MKIAISYISVLTPQVHAGSGEIILLGTLRYIVAINPQNQTQTCDEFDIFTIPVAVIGSRGPSNDCEPASLTARV